MGKQIQPSRRVGLSGRVLVGAALALVAVAAVIVAVAVSTAGSDPAIRITRTSPLGLEGSRFEPDERVRVSVTAEESHHARRVRAGPGGSFQVQYEDLAVDRCSTDVVAVATGSSGSRATAKFPQLQCPLGVP